MAQDICIRNTAGPAKGQAVALRVSAEAVVIHRCRIEAYQDSLYAHWGKQFYSECYITGTVDFICGHATAVFQHCQIEARKPKFGQSNVITAHSRTNPSDKSGFSIQKCNITASSELAPVRGTIKTYLGRPWGNFSRVIFLESFMDALIDPAGYIPWNKSDIETLSTLSYIEYKNKGLGAVTTNRVQWKGFKVMTDPKEAIKFTVGKFINQDFWLNSTGVPYEDGL
ncbi:probable pectinesterase 30 [Arabidopsis lyrata subsp. lyrata]|nr:probable pectinesterase 30 [Arabidopsis lyrata subsp. lyrata]|eukprot:XP_020865689.1 probable pectinesterase 30 [Arabidopsis lyrata subsp. lyrata]